MLLKSCAQACLIRIMIATRSLWLAIVKDLLLLCEELILELEDLERQCKNLKARQAVEPGYDTVH